MSNFKEENYKKEENNYQREYSRSPKRFPSPNLEENNTNNNNESSSEVDKKSGQRNPHPNLVFGVFGLDKSTTTKTLEDYFSKFGKLKRVNLITDREKNESKGYAFIYYYDLESAVKAKVETHFAKIEGKEVRTDYSFQKKKPFL
jgi:transformer-2 protein